MKLRVALETFRTWKTAKRVDRDTLDNIREFLCDVYGIDEEDFVDAYNDMIEKAA